MTIDRVPIELQGGPGGNGVVTLYFLDGAAAQPAVCDFVDVWKNGAPDDVSFLVRDTGDRIDEKSGTLTGVWSGGVESGDLGFQSGPWIAGTGFRINWQTAGLVAGKRVRGRSFIVPLYQGAFNTNGNPDGPWLNTILDAADALIADTPGNLVIWSRPRGDMEGSAHPVVSASVPQSPAGLRSRRT